MDVKNLISECNRGSTAAHKYFFDKYAATMYLLCRRYMRSNEDAEEVMMNGFVQCFDALHAFTYKTDEAFVSWIKKIFINECLQALRKKSSIVFLADVVAIHKEYDDNTLEELTAEEIYKLITRLPAGYRTIFNLYAIEGYSHKEIAGLLHISEGTSKSQLSKARQMLQKMITGQTYHAANK